MMYSGDDFYGDDVTSPLVQPLPPPQYCVVYRTGGTDNFSWRRSLAMSKADAEQTRRDCERMGYKAMVVDYQRSMAVGLPETYDV